MTMPAPADSTTTQAQDAATAPVEPAAAPNPGPEPSAPQNTTQTAPTEPAKPAKRTLEDSLAKLDDETRKFVIGEVAKARSEAKNLRERAKDDKNEIVSAVSKALGLETAAPDPAALTQQLAESTASARQAQVELAVYRTAGQAGGDPAALLDSVSFMRALADVDPANADAVTAAITSAVAANPNLGAAPQRRLPAPNPAAGSSANGTPDLESQIADALKRGDTKAYIALQNQKLAALAR